MRVSYLFCWRFRFSLFQISTIASSKMKMIRRSMPPLRPAAIGITGRFVGLGSSVLATGVGEDERLVGMHIGVLSSPFTEQSPEMVIETSWTVTVGLVCTHCCNCKSKSVLFTPSKLIILARKMTCPVLLLAPHTSLTPSMYFSEKPHLQIISSSLATSSAMSLALSEV